MREGLPKVVTLFPDARDVPQAFLAYESATNDTIEVAIRQFAEYRTWPKLTPIERIMLSFRLEFAVSIGSLLCEQPAPWEDAETADASRNTEDRLGWLLLFAWGQHGFTGLHDNLRRLLTEEDVD